MSVKSQVVISLAVASLLCCLEASRAQAVTVNVPATATGGFGAPVSGFTNFVLGQSVALGGNVISETVRLSATGSINIGIGAQGPDGISLAIAATPSEFSPLEEKLVDAGNSYPGRVAPNYGAVIYAFVPEAVASHPSFLAQDEDTTTVGIDAEWLFLVGSGPVDVTVTTPGTFYIGINDTYIPNNSGSLSVTLETIAQEIVVPAPEPSSLLLLGMGILALARRRRNTVSTQC